MDPLESANWATWNLIKKSNLVLNSLIFYIIIFQPTLLHIQTPHLCFYFYFVIFYEVKKGISHNGLVMNMEALYLNYLFQKFSFTPTRVVSSISMDVISTSFNWFKLLWPFKLLVEPLFLTLKLRYIIYWWPNLSCLTNNLKFGLIFLGA